ncbi:MAG: AAA family ATPase [Acidimicrobiales bacterium]
MLVGRDLLLQAGEVALRNAAEGRGRLLLLTGEAGIGKTTLARAIAGRAEASGAMVRTGACWESERLPPFTPWIDVLRRPGGDACAIAGDRLEGAGGPEAHDASDALRARGRRFADVVDALRRCADDCPQAVVLEDLHWADRESLELLVALAAHLPTMGVLVIGTYREDELSPSAGLASIGGNADRLALRGLDAVAVGLVLGDALSRQPTADEQEAVLRQTGGNPLFVTQVARLLDSGATAVPTGVRDVLARRLARMTTSCDRMLGAASVLGVTFDQRVVEAMTRASAAVELDEAVTAHLIAPGDAAGSWGFVHALVQATRYERLGSQERARWHREAFHSLQATGLGPPAALAHHAARGDFDRDDPRPAEALIAAGDEAQARLAWPDALAAYERALDLAPPGEVGRGLRAEAWLGVGAARLRRGEGDVRAAFDEAAGLARSAGRPDLVARAALGFSVGLGGFEVRLLDHHQIELLEEAADLLDSAAPLLPLVLARLSVALAFIDSEERRADLAERAVELARESGDAIVLGHALAAWCDAHADPRHVGERLLAAAEAVALGQRAGDQPLELLGRRLRVVGLLERGQHAAANAEVAAYESVASALGDPLYTWYGALWRAAIAAADGRYTEARVLAERALELGALGGSANSLLLVRVHELMVAVDQRDRAASKQAMATMLQFFPEIISPYADVTNAFRDVALGDLDRARLSMHAVSPDRIAALPRDSEWVPLLVQLAAVSARLGLPALVRYVRAELEPFADCAGVEGIGAYLHGSVHRFLGLLAAAEGDAEAARSHVGSARAAAAGAGIVVEALTDVDGAWALAQSGDERDGAAAIELARRAGAAFSRADLSVLASEADLLSDGPEQGSAASASLSRLGDTWSVRWEGLTVHVRHAKGVGDLAVLLARPGREVHVRELEGVGVREQSSYQAALDPVAVEQYKGRLRDLEEDLDEADRHGDIARAASLAAERDALVAELTRAFGLSGRARSVASDPDERLRKAVSARVRASIARLEQLDPGLGRHLRLSVRTGFWCAYEPERPVRWVVSGG